MGQYYKAIKFGTKEYVSSWAFDCGAKLMEHSWLGNDYVGAAMFLISKGQPFYCDKIIWAGDYAENEFKNSKDIGQNLYNLCYENKIDIIVDVKKVKKLRYIVNLDTKEYVAICKSLVSEIWVDSTTNKKHLFRIHPLPLLTCDGNGNGLGDFMGKDPNNLIGKWKRNRVVAQQRKPRNCKELIFDLVEK